MANNDDDLRAHCAYIGSLFGCRIVYPINPPKFSLLDILVRQNDTYHSLGDTVVPLLGPTTVETAGHYPYSVQRQTCEIKGTMYRRRIRFQQGNAIVSSSMIIQALEGTPIQEKYHAYTHIYVPSLMKQMNGVCRLGSAAPWRNNLLLGFEGCRFTITDGILTDGTIV